MPFYRSSVHSCRAVAHMSISKTNASFKRFTPFMIDLFSDYMVFLRVVADLCVPVLRVLLLSDTALAGTLSALYLWRGSCLPWLYRVCLLKWLRVRRHMLSVSRGWCLTSCAPASRETCGGRRLKKEGYRLSKLIETLSHWVTGLLELDV